MKMRHLATLVVLASLWTNQSLAKENILHVYNWSDYIAEDTIANFGKRVASRWSMTSSTTTRCLKPVCSKYRLRSGGPQLGLSGRQLKLSSCHWTRASSPTNDRTQPP